MTGRVLTRAFGFETRQHSIMGIDLGEGVPRRAFVIGSILLVAWAGLLTLVAGPPTPNTLILYVTAPGLLIWFGLQPSEAIARRRRMTMWMLRFRFILVGHVGIIDGALARRRHDLLRVRERITFAWWRRTFGSQGRDWDPWTPQAAASRHIGPGPAIHTGQPIRVLGFDAMSPIRERSSR